jgi:hypothetical protein
MGGDMRGALPLSEPLRSRDALNRTSPVVQIIARDSRAFEPALLRAVSGLGVLQELADGLILAMAHQLIPPNVGVVSATGTHWSSRIGPVSRVQCPYWSVQSTVMTAKRCVRHQQECSEQRVMRTFMRSCPSSAPFAS